MKRDYYKVPPPEPPFSEETLIGEVVWQISKWWKKVITTLNNLKENK